MRAPADEQVSCHTLRSTTPTDAPQGVAWRRGDEPKSRPSDGRRVTVPVPDLDQGLAFYRDRLGHDLIWRNDEVGQAGLRLPNGETADRAEP